MSDAVDVRLRRAMALIKNGDKAAAKQVVSEILKVEPSNADAWYLAAYLSDSQEQKIKLLQKTLSHNSNHDKARQALAKLQEAQSPSSDLPAFNPEPKADKTKQTGMSSWMIGVLILILVIIAGLLAIIAFTQISQKSSQEATANAQATQVSAMTSTATEATKMSVMMTNTVFGMMTSTANAQATFSAIFKPTADAIYATSTAFQLMINATETAEKGRSTSTLSPSTTPTTPRPTVTRRR